MQRSGAGPVGSLPAYGAMENASPVSLAENPSRQYLSMRSFYLVTKYAMAAQQTSVIPQDLRHRFGFRMAEQVPLHRLAQLIGHDSLETTRPRYIARFATHG
jgi:site-specific recombinase XerD